MTRPLKAGALAAGAWLTMAVVGGAAGNDPFAFLAPDVTVDMTARARLNAGQPVVHVAAGKDGFLALSAIIRVNTTPDRLADWARHVEALQRGRYIPEIGRFSDPPRLDDLRGLTLDPEEMDAIRRCRPGDCAVKLSDLEIAQIQAARDRVAAEALFRRLLVTRAAQYLRRGDACALPYHDHRAAVRPAEVFGVLLERTPFLPTNLACYADYLRLYPLAGDDASRESFLYWSKETLGMKPIISITHYSIARFAAPGMPAVASVAKQVYATHYKNASLTMTALAGVGETPYLVYLHRSQVDAFQGFFGGMVRRMVERRVKAEAPGVLDSLRTRLESGEPPSAVAAGAAPR